MQRLEVSRVVRLIHRSLGVKGLTQEKRNTRMWVHRCPEQGSNELFHCQHTTPPGPRNDCDRNLELLKKKCVRIHVSDFSGRHSFESCGVYAAPIWLTQETYCYGRHIFPCCGWQCKVVTVPKVIDGFIL